MEVIRRICTCTFALVMVAVLLMGGVSGANPKVPSNSLEHGVSFPVHQQVCGGDCSSCPLPPWMKNCWYALPEESRFPEYSLPTLENGEDVPTHFHIKMAAEIIPNTCSGLYCPAQITYETQPNGALCGFNDVGMGNPAKMMCHYYVTSNCRCERTCEFVECVPN